MNTIKKNREEKEQKWLNAEKRGAAVLWGVQKIKRRKKDKGRATGPGLRLGRFDPRILGRFGREYIRVETHFFPHFFFSFSLFSLFHSVLSLSSLSSLIHLLRREE